MAQLLIPHAGEERVRMRPGQVVEQISPAPRDIWRGVLRDDPGATALQTPEYFDAVLTATGGTDASRFYQLRDGRQLVLPLVQRSRLGLQLADGYPSGYGPGGMLATGGLLGEDVRTVVRDLRGRALTLRIGGSHHTSEQWAAGLLPGVHEESRRVEVIDLEGRNDLSVDEFRESQFPPKVRSSLSWALRQGVEVELDTTGRLIPVFHEIYRAWVERGISRSGWSPVLARRMALRQEPLKKFVTVAAAVGAACRVFVAWHQGRPVAASIMLTYGQHGITWRSYSIEELAAPVNANLLTRVAGIEDALRAGCRYVDLGQPGEALNLLADQSRLGASPRSVVDLRLESAGLTRLRTARGRAEGVMVRALTRSSVSSNAGAPRG